MHRLLLVLSLLITAAPAWAQSAPASKPAPKKKTLKRLKKERDIAEDAFLEARINLDALISDRRKLLAKQKLANAKLIAAQKLKAIPTRQLEVRTAKQELHRIGQQLATNQIKLEPQLTALELLRLYFVKALAAYATRALEVAYRTRPTRPKQADQLTRDATSDLKRRTQLLKGMPPPPAPPKPPPFDPVFTTTDRLEWLLARMQEQVGRFRQQLKDLLPIEEAQQLVVKRLTRLARRGAGKRDLGKAIEREQAKLETIKGLRRTTTNYEVTYLKQIKRVSDTLQARARKKPK